MVDFAPSVLLTTLRLSGPTYRSWRHCRHHGSKQGASGLTSTHGMGGGTRYGNLKATEFGRQTRVDENLAYLMGFVGDSVIHAHTDCSYVPGCSDACRYESVNKQHASVGIAASYFVATVCQAVSSVLLHREVVIVTLCGYNTLHIVVMVKVYLCKWQISRRNVK